MPGRRPEKLAICVGNAIGNCACNVMPLWISHIAQRGRLLPAHVGWLASAELLSMAFSAILLSRSHRHLNPRAIASKAALFATLANMLAMLPPTSTFIAGRLLSGAAMGTLLACVVSLAGHRPDAQRVLALMQGTSALFSSIIFFAAPGLLQRFGVGGLFGFLACASAMAYVAAQRGLPTEFLPYAGRERFGATVSPAPLVASVGLGMMILGEYVIWIYIVTIADSLGIGAHAQHLALTIAFPVALLGPLAAHQLGERLGLLGPLLVGQFLMMADALVIVSTPSPLAFAIATSTLATLVLFCIPYAIAIVCQVDASPRFGMAAPAVMMIGGSIAPAIGGPLAGSGRLLGLAGLAAAFMSASCLLFSGAVSLGKQRPVARA